MYLFLYLLISILAKTIHKSTNIFCKTAASLSFKWIKAIVQWTPKQHHRFVDCAIYGNQMKNKRTLSHPNAKDLALNSDHK